MFVVTDGDGQYPVALFLTVLEEGMDGSDKTNADLVARVLVFTFSYEL